MFRDFNEEYPDLSSADIIAIDLETYDPKLKDEGAVYTDVMDSFSAYQLQQTRLRITTT